MNGATLISGELRRLADGIHLGCETNQANTAVVQRVLLNRLSKLSCLLGQKPCAAEVSAVTEAIRTAVA